jgi:hypothetical protein
MPGLVPGIHVLPVARQRKAWMAGTSLDKPGHDEVFKKGLILLLAF